MVLIFTGNNVRMAREQRGLNQLQLAEAVRCPQSILSDVELGKREPWPKLASRLSEVLEVSISDLFPKGFKGGR